MTKLSEPIISNPSSVRSFHQPTQALPLTIPAGGKTASAMLPVGDDLAAADRQGTLASAELRIRISDPRVAGAAEVRLNGLPLTAVEQDSKEEGWLLFRPRPEQFRLGRNELVFRTAKASPGGAVAEVTRVELSVKYKQ